MKKKLKKVLNRQKPILLSGTEFVSWNAHKNYNAEILLDTNKKLFFERLESGDHGLLKIVQGAGGSHTLALPSNSKVASNGLGLLNLSTIVGSVDIATFYYNGVNLFWHLSLNFS